MLNTPPTFAWYMAGLVFKWLKKQGGVAAMGERNGAKARALYAAIDGSSLYRNRVAQRCAFLDERDLHARGSLSSTPRSSSRRPPAGLHNLKGHRVLGGMRASLYNAMPLAGRRGAGRLHARIRAQARMRCA